MHKPHRVLTCLCLLLALTQLGWVPSTHSEKSSNPSPAASTPKLDLDFGGMPLYFVENQGQLDKQVAYYIQGSDKTIYFTPEGVTFALTAPTTPTLQARPLDERESAFPISPSAYAAGSTLRSDNQQSAIKNHQWSVKLDFVDANPDVHPVGQEQTEAIISYFKGRPEEWHTGLPTYNRIVYEDLWPGIDLVYFGTSDRLKYEFIVHPGADPRNIRLAYRGATSVSLNPAGQLEVTTPLGGFSDDAPLAYQEIDGQRVTVAVSYSLETASPSSSSNPWSSVLRPSSVDPNHQSKIKNQKSYAFSLGRYDPSLPLVIDPAVLVYAGFIGGSTGDYGRDIAVDGMGYAYVTGFTNSIDASFPVKVGPDLTFNGIFNDAFVVKVEVDGTGLVYAGYIGGSEGDSGHSIAVDEEGNAYVTGWTGSSEASFPVTGGPDLTYNGDGDAFVVKVESDGTGLVYAGYIGGSDSDGGSGIAVDEEENSYVTGYTCSGEASFPVRGGPDLTHNGGDSDAFVARVEADGNGLVYAGYIGGSSYEHGFSIAVDEMGNAYLTGLTSSIEASFPVTGGPDLSYNGGDWDAFIAKVNADGTGLAYAGYIGGSAIDTGNCIAVDETGNAYVSGTTSSSEASFPVMVGPDLTWNDGRDAFVTKVEVDGTGLVYAGYIGGSGQDDGNGIAVDEAGNAYSTGRTSSSEASFPVRGGPGLTYHGGGDAFVARLVADGTRLDYAGYIGSRVEDSGYAIAVDGAGNAYITGVTNSNEGSFPVRGGPDLTHNGGDDVFIAKVLYPTIQLFLPVIKR